MLRPPQSANVLGITLDEAIAYFDEFLAPGWQEIGVTPLEFGRYVLAKVDRSSSSLDIAWLTGTTPD